MNKRQRTKLRARFRKIGLYRQFNTIIKSIENVVRKQKWRSINDLEAKDLIPAVRKYIPRMDYIKIEFNIDDPAIQKKEASQ